MEHMPYILLLQTLVLIIVEKFTFKIPRIAQKVERFYQNIVEESLFGKDPVGLDYFFKFWSLKPREGAECKAPNFHVTRVVIFLLSFSMVHKDCM